MKGTLGGTPSESIKITIGAINITNNRRRRSSPYNAWII
jgi:hypothetical protein